LGCQGARVLGEKRCTRTGKESGARMASIVEGGGKGNAFLTVAAVKPQELDSTQRVIPEPWGKVAVQVGRGQAEAGVGTKWHVGGDDGPAVDRPSGLAVGGKLPRIWRHGLDHRFAFGSPDRTSALPNLVPKYQTKGPWAARRESGCRQPVCDGASEVATVAM